MFLSIVLIIMIFALVTLNKIEKPLEELASLPHCSNGVIVTNDFKTSIIRFANEYIKNGTGDYYFSIHYHFMRVEYSTVDCVFTVVYDYTYGYMHSPMSISIKAYSENNFEVINVNAFIRPIYIYVSEDEAISIAKEQGINYDYYNREVDIPHQTIVYKFYKKGLAEDILVLEIDAQSKEIKKPKHISETIPIV